MLSHRSPHLLGSDQSVHSVVQHVRVQGGFALRACLLVGFPSSSFHFRVVCFHRGSIGTSQSLWLGVCETPSHQQGPLCCTVGEPFAELLIDTHGVLRGSWARWCSDEDTQKAVFKLLRWIHIATSFWVWRCGNFAPS